MEIVILPGPEDVAREAARRVAGVVRRRPGAVLGLATGSSPLGLYAELARQVADGALDVTGVSGFALDEYVGIPLEHPQSYASVIRRTVTEPLGLDPRRVHVPDGRAPDLAAAADAYERAIRAAGGIDLQILGIGANGHLGFNEPTSSLASRTRVKTLAPRTRADNARFFAGSEEVPLHCLTQGLGTILEARELLLVAQGEAKADAVAAAVEGPLAAICPASVLQLHPRAAMVLDEAAACRLRLADYYRHTHAHAHEPYRSRP
ncbi:glucosamine-6-phosphate deaminase [Blastococcus xanthinilyticus]|uniref:Glucosamine-6-phosphate deaminase n=1 Tax=Blastococcus xanthinilyticus TaxID=1564164 RepID=A0A5S5CPT0_9ACTN|nr:glucosamine-6-phosphate deaminase [Blastococcus xanthinilyticus]TYP83658.1 glucosamine-6-phosphate deaminase [Blastococcus xanthinilyticus]